MRFEHSEALRPCYVKTYTYNKKVRRYVPEGERKALFHGWFLFGQVLDPSPLVGGHAGGILHHTMGIIEFEDGTVHQVQAEDIRFIGNEFANYCFEEMRNENQT